MVQTTKTGTRFNRRQSKFGAQGGVPTLLPGGNWLWNRAR